MGGMAISNQSERIEKLKKKCLELYEFWDNLAEYEKGVFKLRKTVIDLGLTEILDPTHFIFLFMVVIRRNRGKTTFEDFKKEVNEFLSIKKLDFYFQLVELSGFPENFRLGYGNLVSFTKLPDSVKKIALKLAKGDTSNIYNNKQKDEVLDYACKQLLIPEDPNVGFWLRISPPKAISFNILMENAFVHAQDSLDILRIASPMRGRTRLPQLAIEYNVDVGTAFPCVRGIEIGRYPYDPDSNVLIQRLNDVCVNPSCDLEERLKDALHFFRMAEIHAPPHQQLFFYVAAIERLILSQEPNLNHKFCERAAILTEKESGKRIEHLKELKALYKMRSTIAHGRKTNYDFYLTNSARSYLRNIILKILYLIDTKKIKRVSPKENKENESLEEYINQIIFSG